MEVRPARLVFRAFLLSTLPCSSDICPAIFDQFVNTGLQIDAGDTNSFIGCSFEGVETGEKPSKTPTAILIKKSSVTGADNNNNIFICARFEANHLDLDNRNRYTEFYASNIRFPKKVRGVRPLYVVGGYDPSYTPLIMPGIVYPEGNMPDMPSAVNLTRRVEFHGGFKDRTVGE